MIYLFASVILISYLILSFKMLQRMGLNLFQSIVFNYITCVFTGTIVNKGYPLNQQTFSADWFPWAIFMGSMFIVLFNLIGITTQRINVAVASVSNRLSLIIPVIFSIYLYNETLTVLQWIGILIALFSVFLTCWPNRQTEEKNTQRHFLLYLLPAILFIGSGLLDTTIKYVETTFINDANYNQYLITSFGAAAFIGLIVLLVNVAIGKQVLTWKNVIAGIVIGVPNYFSIWYLVKFLKNSPLPSSAAIPLNNMGVVMVSTLAAWLLYKENLSKTNWIGIISSVVAIFLIAYGSI